MGAKVYLLFPTFDSGCVIRDAVPEGFDRQMELETYSDSCTLSNVLKKQPHSGKTVKN